MENTTKKQIRLLSERYNHEIEYDKEIIIVKNDLNYIKIWRDNKFEYIIEHNVPYQSINHKVKRDSLIDLLINILKREDNYEIEVKNNYVLNFEMWEKEEKRKFSLGDLIKLNENWKSGGIEYYDLGGNRFEAEFYKGLLILHDDLNICLSNVIEI